VSAPSTETRTHPSETYRKAILDTATRVLSLMDRERLSPTRGCMDRTFWAWKFTDFPGSRFQEGLCFLSFLWATEFEGNQYYKSPKLLEWIIGGFEFWIRIQRSAGDFDEAYPNERSLAATAFTTHYMCEAWRFLDGALPAGVERKFQEAVQRAAEWLCKNDETHGFLSNHLAAAGTALLHATFVTNNPRFAERSRYFLDKILAHQSDEGWYEEYGAADPGYQTHGSYYLARYLQLSGDPRVAASLSSACEFLSHFVHPDKSLGGEYTSRNTQTYYPAAFEMLAGHCGHAAWICEEMRPAVEELTAAGLGTVDAWNLFPLLNNYVFAWLATTQFERQTEPKAPPTKPGIVYFPQAGLLKVRKRRYDLYVGLGKGGVIKLFDRIRGTLVYSNCGWVGKLNNGKTVSNQWNVPERPVELSRNEIRVGGRFYQISRPVMSPFKFLGFRVFSLSLGRMPKLAYWLKKLLVKVLIYKKRELDLEFTRRIVCREDGIEVHDDLRGDGRKLASLGLGDVFTTIHMGSSRYFVPNELRTSEGTDDAIDTRQLTDGVQRSYRINLDAA